MDHSVIGRRISKARLKLGMSTQQLAERIGKSQATVSRIENGKQGVTLPLLNTIARVLEIHPFSLLGNQKTLFAESPQKGVLLNSILKDGRERSRLSLESVASRTGISLDKLEEFESGDSLPTEDEVNRLCDLYPLDTDMTRQVWCAEQNCPRLISRFNSLTLLLNDCLALLQENRRNASEAFESLCQRIEDHLCISEEKPEFSNSESQTASKNPKLSTCLQEALRDEDFLKKVELLAQDWFETDNAGISALRKIEGTLDGYSEQN